MHSMGVRQHRRGFVHVVTQSVCTHSGWAHYDWGGGVQARPQHIAQVASWEAEINAYHVLSVGRCGDP